MLKPSTVVKGSPRFQGAGPIILPEARHEIWHQNPQGDMEGAFFDLPIPVKKEHVQKAALQCWRNWVSMQGGEDKQASSEPRIIGPYYIPEYNALDMARYYMLCRWKRTRPLLVSVDVAELYATTEAPDAEEMFRVFLANMGELSKTPLGQLEQATRRNESFIKDAPNERARRARRDYKLTHLKGS